MPKSRVTVTQLRHAPFASEETLCFEATVCFDGTPYFRASNTGRGGPDHYFPLKGQTQDDKNAKQHEIEAYAASLPPFKFYGTIIHPSMETLLEDAINRVIAEKKLAASFKKNLLFTSQSASGIRQVSKRKVLAILSTPTQELTPHCIEAFKRFWKVKELLNELPLEKAMDILDEDSTRRTQAEVTTPLQIVPPPAYTPRSTATP